MNTHNYYKGLNNPKLQCHQYPLTSDDFYKATSYIGLKIYVLIIPAILLISLFFSALTFAGPGKYALIIAIGDYPSKGGWPKISSENDIGLIKGALLKQGFDEKNISLIADSAATKKGIENSFNTLIAKINKGDIVVVHYSGHGQQIFDDNGDEIDGYDEAIVPFDAPVHYFAGYTGDKHIRDDELGSIVDQLRLKAGNKGQVLVFLDACHSGTGTRGASKVRGGMTPLAPPDYNPNVKSQIETSEKGFGMDNNVAKTRGGNEDIAPFVLFSGASANELNYETNDDNGKGVGSLSYAISKAFTTMDNNTSYRGLFAKVLTLMAVVAPRQTPMLEGDVDYKVFNGQTVKQEPYFLISEAINENGINLDGGNLSGLFKDDQVALFPAGTASIKNLTALATGKISSADNFKSIIQFDKAFKIDNIKSYWVFVTRQNFGDKKVVVAIDHFKNNEFENQLTTMLSGLSLVTLNTKNPEIIIRESKSSRGEYSISIYATADGFPIKDIKIISDVDLMKVSDQVKNYAQSKFIREIKLDDPKHKIIIELLPATMVNGKIQVKPHDTLINDIIPSFKVGDTLLIKVINVGKEAAYFNILDIQPDGIINALVPRKGVDGKEYKLEAGTSKILVEKPIKLSPPVGTEIFKVFATNVPINFTSIVGTRGENKGNGHPLEKLLQSTYQTRGADDVSISDEDPGSTFDFTFKIIQK